MGGPKAPTPRQGLAGEGAGIGTLPPEFGTHLLWGEGGRGVQGGRTALPGPRRPIISQIGGQVVRFHESDANMATSLNSNALVGNAQKHPCGPKRELRGPIFCVCKPKFQQRKAQIPRTGGQNSAPKGQLSCILAVFGDGGLMSKWDRICTSSHR